MFGGCVILILGLLLILSGCILLTEKEEETDKYDIQSYHMMILCAGGVITLVGLSCFGLRLVTARRVRLSVRSSVSEFSHGVFSKKPHSAVTCHPDPKHDDCHKQQSLDLHDVHNTCVRIETHDNQLSVSSEQQDHH